MPRDKKIVHRSTSDVEETSDPENEQAHDETNLEKLEEERKKVLKDALLKRTIALKEQRTKKIKT